MPPEIADKIRSFIDDVRNSNGAILFDAQFKVIGRLPCEQLSAALSNVEGVHVVLSDCIINDEIVKAAESAGVKYLIGRKVLSTSPNMFVGTYS